MVRVLQKLPFADDCLKNTLEQDLEVLLDAVPFQTNEVTICKALAYWRKAENLDSEDDFDDEVCSACCGACARAGLPLTQRVSSRRSITCRSASWS